MTHVYAILANPRKESFTSSLFYTTVEDIRKTGAYVDVLDLYDRSQDVLFYNPHLKDQLNPFFEENKQRFMAAERLFIVYPIFWYAVPGIMKCWMDLITSYAFDYKTSDFHLLSNYAKPKHSITKALVINSASMSYWFRLLRTRNSGSEMVKETFKFLGVNNYKFYEINSANTLTPKYIKKHLNTVLKTSKWLLT